MDEGRVLVSTISPVSGGVPAMTRFVTDTLQSRGWRPVLAHYEPYSVTPELSVPSFRMLLNKPGKRARTTWDTVETHAIGAWLPELEFTHYTANRLWRELMDSCSRFVAVCGNVLAAVPFVQTGRSFTAWVAAGWEEDRRDRVQQFPLARKLLDRWVNAPVLRRMERDNLRAGGILPLSEHTRVMLDSIAGEPVCGNVLPMPIDCQFFQPDPVRVRKGRIGFAGRLDDPRKNVGLLIDAVARLINSGASASAVLVGGKLDPACEAKIQRWGLAEHIECFDYVPREQLRALLQSLDVFVVPSHQEGLCISALEAMACGCPVISTRCGGPQEFVRDGETGFLVDFDIAAMTDAIHRVSHDRELRSRLSQAARQMVAERYNRERCERIFWSSFEHQEESLKEAAG